MYIESNPGELGFPHHRMGPGGEGGWRHHMQSGGPGAEMQVQAQDGMRHHHHHRRGMRGADGVEIMGFGADAPAGAAPPMVMAPADGHAARQPPQRDDDVRRHGRARTRPRVRDLEGREVMISGNANDIQIMGGMPAGDVEIMGFGTITSESLQGFGTITSRELQGFGADAAPMTAMISPPKHMPKGEVVAAVAVVLALGAAVAYALHKK